MKKTYIEPKNTVVRINLETLIANSPTGTQDFLETPAAKDGDNVIMEGREVIKSQDVWEEW